MIKDTESTKTRYTKSANKTAKKTTSKTITQTKRITKKLTALLLSVIMVLSGFVMVNAFDEVELNSSSHNNSIEQNADSVNAYIYDADTSAPDIVFPMIDFDLPPGYEIVWGEPDEFYIDWDSDWTGWESDEDMLPYTIIPWQPGDTHYMGSGDDGISGRMVPLSNGPNITFPQQNTQIILGSFNVSWNQFSGATGYTIAMRNLNTNVLVLPQQVLGANARSFQINLNHLTGGHRFRVAMSARVGTTDVGWTEREFWVATAGPNITAPTTNQIVAHQAFEARWNAAPNATSYLVSLRNLNTNELVLNRVTNIGTTRTITHAQLRAGHQFRLAVGSVAGGREGHWTERGFSVRAENPTLSLSPVTTSWTFSAGADAINRTVNTNQPGGWTASSNATWLTATNSGVNGGNLRIAVSTNSGNLQRQGTVTVRAGNATPLQITVTQQAHPTLSLNRSTWNPEHTIDSATFNINTNQPIGNIHASSNQSWLTVEGTGITRTMRVTANTGTAQRSGTITVSGGGLTQWIAVTQAGVATTLTLDPASTTINDNNLTRTIAVGGTATGNITFNRGALPAAVQLSANPNTNTITVTGTRPAAGQQPITGTHDVTVNRGGVSQALRITVNLTPLAVPVARVTFDAGGGDVINDAGLPVASFVREVPIGDRTVLPPVFPPSPQGVSLYDDFYHDDFYDNIDDNIVSLDIGIEASSMFMFSGWFHGQNSLGIVGQSIYINQDVTLRAGWTQNPSALTIRFDNNQPGGFEDPRGPLAQHPPIGMSIGARIGNQLPPLPVDHFRIMGTIAHPHEHNTLHNFPQPIGWFTERDGGVLVTEDTVFSQSSTIYLRWTDPARHMGVWSHWNTINLTLARITDSLWRDGITQGMAAWSSDARQPFTIINIPFSNNEVLVRAEAPPPQFRGYAAWVHTETWQDSALTQFQMNFNRRAIELAVEQLGLCITDAIATLTAHEIGHVVGLADNPLGENAPLGISLMSQEWPRRTISRPTAVDIENLRWIHLFR